MPKSKFWDNVMKISTLVKTAQFLFGFWYIALFWTSCHNRDVQRDTYTKIEGSTMGTYYRVIYGGDVSKSKAQKGIERILSDINRAVSTYDPDAYISKVNMSASGSVSDMPAHFKTNIERAWYWHGRSDGYFDPSVMPLVNYWGFGYTPKRAVVSMDSSRVDSIMTIVGLDKWSFEIEHEILTKLDHRQQLDFSALAKGYAVDMVGAYVGDQLKATNYLVDIGGELRARGVNSKGKPWTIGINIPTYDAGLQDVMVYLRLSDISLATSGNYRNYHEVNGAKYGHSINPKSGYPFQDRLLSISVLSKDCIDADAIATACMAMGLNKARTFITEIDGTEACFLAGNEDGTISTYYTDGFIQYTYEP